MYTSTRRRVCTIQTPKIQRASCYIIALEETKKNMNCENIVCCREYSAEMGSAFEKCVMIKFEFVSNRVGDCRYLGFPTRTLNICLRKCRVCTHVHSSNMIMVPIACVKPHRRSAPPGVVCCRRHVLTQIIVYVSGYMMSIRAHTRDIYIVGNVWGLTEAFSTGFHLDGVTGSFECVSHTEYR